jgi:outer membrane biosynthesis protein TonB
MKTRIATLLVVLGMLIITTSSASEPVPASKAVSKSVADLIKSELSYPDFARESNFECCVLIRVKILDDGRFDVDCANCNHDQLKKYVIETVENIVSEEYALYAGYSVSMKIKFKILET